MFKMESIENKARKVFPKERKISKDESAELHEIILTGMQGTSIPITKQSVKIVPSSSDNYSGNKNIKVFDIADFCWETKSYAGKLVCMHISGTYIAYILKGRSTREGIVRIMNHKTGAHAFIKSRRQVKDVSFAHRTDEIILAFVDNVGSLFVYEIIDEKGNIICNNVLHISKKTDNQLSESSRVIWCPYIPEEASVASDSTEDTTDVSKVLVVIHDLKAQMWNIDVVTKEYGKGPMFVEDIKVGYQNVITGHSMIIKDAAFSPDGYALALASTNGEIQFFEVFSEEENVSPRCLHQWKPHDGRSLSCLYFLDDHKCPKSNVQFWKFALTGADNNQEIKLWSCVDWVCLQTIRFASSSRLKAELDLTGSYFLLSDISHKGLYVLEIEQELTKSLARFSSITEYFIDQPILSFVVADVVSSQITDLKLESLNEEKQTAADIAKSDISIQDRKEVYIKLLWINAKFLQECHICINSSWDTCSKNFMESIFLSSTAYCDKLSDVSSDLSSPDLQNSIPIPSITAHSPTASISSSHHTPPPNLQSCKTENVLLTPEDFITSSPSSTVRSHQSLQEESLIKSPLKMPANAKRNISSFESSFDQKRDINIEHSVLNSSPLAKADNSSSVSGSSKFNDSSTRSLHKEENSFSLNNSIKRLPASASQCRKSQHDENLKGEQNRNNTLVRLKKLQLSVNKLVKLVPALTDCIQNNQNSIGVLQKKITEQQQHMEMLNSLQEKVEILDKAISYKLEKTFKTEMHSEFSKLQAVISQNRNDHEILNDHSSSISQTTSITIGNKLEKCVKNETKNNILPYISNFLETFKHQLQQDLNQKLTATDCTVKESIGKFVRSKAFTESISNSVVISIERHLHMACVEISQSVVTPSLEKACQSLLQQLTNTFKKGTEEYLLQVDAHLKTQAQEICDSNDKTVRSTVERANEIKLFTEHLFESCISDIEEQMHKHMQELLTKQQEMMLTKVRCLVREEIDQGFKDHTTVSTRNDLISIRSRTTTPLPLMLDLQMQQDQILQSIKQGQFSAAFQQALSAANLNLVLFTCKAVDPSVVFSQYPCPLQQHVILSLIQQLVVDLSINVDMKLRYIEEAVVHLDMTNRVTREHGGAVLRIVHQKLTAFMQANPDHKLQRKLRMLVLAVQYLCNS